ncbi:MAG: hotdog fold thioesterase [Flavisolibacter sp.]
MNTQPPSPREVVDRMLQNDLFSQWLGIVLLDAREGYARVQMLVRPEMVNGLGVVHGGIAFSLADSAFAFACNSRNQLSPALEVSINFTRAVQPGDLLTAEAREIHNGKSTGVYLMTLTNQQGEQVGLCKGTCFHTGRYLIQQPPAS